jgi:hypothetical protein
MLNLISVYNVCDLFVLDIKPDNDKPVCDISFWGIYFQFIVYSSILTFQVLV